jgi:hypothetical protein
VARRGVALASVAAALLVWGCARPVKPIVVDWDLSARHTIHEVRWPEEDLDIDLTEFEPVESVRIRFPGGKVFRPGYPVHNVTLAREGNTVTSIQVDTHPMTNDEAHELSLQLADELAVSTDPIEDWQRERLEKRARGEEGRVPGFQVVGLEPMGGPTGPEPGVKLLYSFDDSRPAIVSTEFVWDG